MSNKRYTEELKIEAVKQVMERAYYVAVRLGTSMAVSPPSKAPSPTSKPRSSASKPNCARSRKSVTSKKDYYVLFYNPIHRHAHAGSPSPVEYEKQYFKQLVSA